MRKEEIQQRFKEMTSSDDTERQPLKPCFEEAIDDIQREQDEFYAFLRGVAEGMLMAQDKWLREEFREHVRERFREYQDERKGGSE